MYVCACEQETTYQHLLTVQQENPFQSYVIEKNDFEDAQNLV